MLKQRLLTAAVLLVVLAVLLAAPAIWLDAVLWLAMAAAGWEWGRLNAAASPWLCGLATLLLAAVLWTAGGNLPIVLWGLVALAWLLGGGLVLGRGVAPWSGLPQWGRLLFGVLLLAFSWLALVQWHALGRNALLSVLALVWAADTGAYAAGRLFGRHKLAPGISPGKTWEGVAGGFAAVLLLGALWLWLDGRLSGASASLYSRLHAWGLPALLGGLAFLVALSVAGDLLESLVKRSAGVKDSSALLPGHGGILDRIDALLPVLPVSWLLVALAAGTGG